MGWAQKFLTFALLPFGFDVQVYTQNVFGIYDGPAAAGIDAYGALGVEA